MCPRDPDDFESMAEDEELDFDDDIEGEDDRAYRAGDYEDDEDEDDPDQLSRRGKGEPVYEPDLDFEYDEDKE